MGPTVLSPSGIPAFAGTTRAYAIKNPSLLTRLVICLFCSSVISALKRGNTSSMRFLVALGQDVEIAVRSHQGPGAEVRLHVD